VVKKAVREDTPNPDFVLKSYIKTLFDEEMKTRRFRPQLPKRAASIPERARQVGLGESTLEGEVREGRLEAFKVGARTLVTDEAFDRWLAGRPRIKP
jgi:excisionase family DNA binding protein